MQILHPTSKTKIDITIRASHMTNDYGEGPWAPAEIFVGGGGASQKKAPHKRSRKGLHMEKK